MPKRKANWWPPSILSDPDVLSVDDEGRFVLCKICHVHYAVHGGKKPKPVIMNSNFRTRAWDVHKERTNSHRLQKQQERLQQAKTQQQQQPQQAADSHTPPHQPQQQQQTQGVQGQQRQPMQPPQAQQQVLASQAPRPSQQREMQASHGQTQARAQSQTMAALASQAQVLAQAPSRPVQGQVQTPTPLTPQQVQHSPSPSLRLQNEAQVLHQQRRQHLQQQQQQQRQQLHERELDEETKEPAGDSARNSPIERPASTASPDAITAVAMSGANSVQSNDGVMNSAGKRPAPAMPAGAPAPIRRRVFRAGSPGSSMQLLAESEAVRRQNAHAYERHSLMAAGAGNHVRRAAPSEHAMAMEQADSSARWRHMHDDVSRALNRRRPQGPASYTSGELRAAKTLAQTETGDLGSNNSERVAKKLQSLNAEYQASTMRHADAYNMRHTDVFDRRSAGYKEYWGTLRNVYASSGPASGGAAGNVAPFRKSHHRSSSALAKPAREESKETEADSTTPDDSGSSEDAFKPTVIVHDASLINAIERLTDATSSQIANLYQRQASDTREALAGLTSVMTDLRVQHGNAFERIIELQEKHLKVMESILEIKLRKEAARNAKSASSSNGSTSESSSGSSPGSSSNGAGSTTS